MDQAWEGRVAVESKTWSWRRGRATGVEPSGQCVETLHPHHSLRVAEPAARLFRAVGLLMAAYPDKRNLLVLLAVVSLAGVWHMVWYLQLYAPLILAITCSWLLMRRGNLLIAGVMLGLVVAVKPNFGVVILALLAA